MARRGNTSFAREKESADVRVEKWRKYKMFLLVVCEDQTTEPAYIKTFKEQFPKHTMYLEVVGAGLDPLGVVNEAIKKKNELAGFANRNIDEVWVVFDKDDADLNETRILRFNNAFETAAQQGFKIAWSNEVFELWLLLHFIEIDPAVPLPRAQVYDLLKDAVNTLLGAEVIADGHSNPAIIPYLTSHGSEQDATARAGNLLQHHAGTPPIAANPATQMHCLVASLREWIAYYNFES